MRGTPRPFRQWKINLLRSLYANYLPDEGQIQIKPVMNGSTWSPRQRAKWWRSANHCRLGKPVSARHPTYFGTGVVMQPLLDTGVPREACAAKARVSSPA